MNNKPNYPILSLVLLLCGVLPAAQASEEVAKKPKIQLAILLDTSGSMSGLIEQAKTHLWDVVNEFVATKQNGERPEFEVALYEYGNSGLAKEQNWIRQILPLTDDLDKVSEMLFALQTNGGDEYCGAVIQRAIGDLAWSSVNTDLKTIFIAGNEPFNQGGVDFKQACPAAITRGVMVNTIFCGPYEKGISTHWQAGARLADGKYLNIDQNQAIVHIEAPQDVEIQKLGEALNSTYIPYGAHGRRGRSNQRRQDANAISLDSSVNAKRQAVKASKFYKNTDWDLVDAVEEGKAKVDDLDQKHLPKEMQSLTLKEQEDFVKEKGAERKAIQKKIADLNKERTSYVKGEREKRSKTGKTGLDTAMIEAVREQAAKKNFNVE